MNPQAWLALAGILVGIIAGFIGQAIYWARFEGRIVTRVDTSESAITELKNSRTLMWGEINELGNRVTKIETACDLRHPDHRRN